MSDVLTLVSQTITVDAYGNESAKEAERTVLCEVDSISQTEFYAAANTELNPEYRFTIFFGDYQGEEICKFNGQRYAIYRTYRSGDNLELYAERKIGA
ncbi:MAG: phage head closure protein [Clostridiales bacterium]|nr:phage head closure protein [Clostridiales bacterium]